MRENDSGELGIACAIAVPHPPLIIPEVGRGEEAAIADTIEAYGNAAETVASKAPDLVILASPHAPLFSDAFFISDEGVVAGDMSRFRASDAHVEFAGDERFARAIADAAMREGIPVALESELKGRSFPGLNVEELDHASFVPLYFLKKAGVDAPVVRIGLSGLSAQMHERLGGIIHRVAEKSGLRAAFVASGDLSHKLKADGPYGFDPAGPKFDERISEIFATGDLEGLFEMDDGMCEDAAECGLRSFQIMAGALKEATGHGGTIDSELLSHEGTFGVGYAVATFSPHPVSKDGEVDPYVALARASVEGFVREGTAIGRPEGLPAEMLDRRAGVFVSLHKGDALRGCIGTIAPVMACIADEVIANGISACSADPRFEPVCPDELDMIGYSVDVLEHPEAIDSPASLDPKRFGVIVTKGFRRGLLLPNLDGVDTVELQLAIAKRKAGIDPLDDDVELERFEVVRHEAGGEARI